MEVPTVVRAEAGGGGGSVERPRHCGVAGEAGRGVAKPAPNAGGVRDTVSAARGSRAVDLEGVGEGGRWSPAAEAGMEPPAGAARSAPGVAGKGRGWQMGWGRGRGRWARRMAAAARGAPRVSSAGLG